MADIALIIPARRPSQRVPDKLLRSFAGTSLFEICLAKISGLEAITYVAAYEQEFIDLAEAYGIRVIKRTKESSLATTGLEAHGEYLSRVEQENILLLTPGQPMIQPSAIVDASRRVSRGARLIAAYPERKWVWDTQERMVNTDPEVNDSQKMNPIWISANCLYGFDRKYYLKSGKYWDFSPGNPEILPISKEEATDIDTMEDFKAAEYLWEAAQ